MTTETSDARGEWVLVPREATHAMELALSDALASGDHSVAECLNLAIAAAPPPAAARGDVLGLVARVAQLREAIESEPEHCFGVNVRAGRAYGVRENLLCIVGLIEAALAAEGVQAGEVSDVPMTPERAAFFLRRFKADEKMLGPHEQQALDFAIEALSQQPAADEEAAEQFRKGWGAGHAAAQQPAAVDEACAWSIDTVDESWDGACGAKWQFTDGGPDDNDMRHCPQCGKRIATQHQEPTT